jgi:ligand-binding SRPBCC domain-containing protein
VSGTVEVRDEPSSAGAVRIERRSLGAYRLSAGLVVPRPIDEVFTFFADAHNLEAITPPWLRFRLRRPSALPVEIGTMIDYQLRLHGLPLRWRSEITVWDPPHRFVDEQRRGPYRKWTHEHSFHDLGGSTEVRDRVDYVLRLRGVGVAGLVERDVCAIFAYRQRELAARFERSLARGG